MEKILLLSGLVPTAPQLKKVGEKCHPKTVLIEFKVQALLGMLEALLGLLRVVWDPEVIW